MNEKARQASKLRTIRYGVRTLLVLTFVCALPLAWLAHKRSEWRHEQAAINAMSPHVAYLKRSYSAPDWLYRAGVRFDFLFRVDHVDFAGYSRPGAVWRHTDPVSRFDDAALLEVSPHLQKLTYLRELHLETTSITDASSDLIAQFEDVEFLNLQDDDLFNSTVRDLMARMPNTKIAFFFETRDSQSR